MKQAKISFQNSGKTANMPLWISEVFQIISPKIKMYFQLVT